MKLDRALLCLDCEEVFSMPRDVCPSCASRSSMSLGRVLQRTSTRPKAKPKKESYIHVVSKDMTFC